MIRFAPVLLLAFFLSACDDQAPPPPPPVSVPQSLSPPPAKVDLPRYVGRWAQSKDLCPDKWTRLWVDELLTADQLRCQILPHSAEGGDRKLRMICIELAKRTREEWRLSYPAPDTLKIKRENEPAQTLVRC